MSWARELALLAVGQSALVLFILLTLLVTRTPVARLKDRWRLLASLALGLAAVQILLAVGRNTIGWVAIVALTAVVTAVLWAYSVRARRRHPPSAEQATWLRKHGRALNWVTVAVLVYVFATSWAVTDLVR